MSSDFYFYVEAWQAGHWNRPEACAEASEVQGRLGAFSWLKGSSPARALFFGDDALLPFYSGWPPTCENGTLFRHYSPMGTADLNSLQPAWIPYPELMVDLWETPGLTLSAQVPARDAEVFGDGLGPFPTSRLQERGWSAEELNRLRSGGRLTDQPVNRSVGQGRYAREKALPTARLIVSWTDSISAYLGTERAQAFCALRRYGTDEALRVIALYA